MLGGAYNLGGGQFYHVLKLECAILQIEDLQDEYSKKIKLRDGKRLYA